MSEVASKGAPAIATKAPTDSGSCWRRLRRVPGQRGRPRRARAGLARTVSSFWFISSPDIGYFRRKRVAVAVSLQALITQKKVTKFRVATSTNFGKVHNLNSPSFSSFQILSSEGPNCRGRANGHRAKEAANAVRAPSLGEAAHELPFVEEPPW
jgi:hypothetical protein